LIGRRIENLADQICEHTLTFVKAPAGYGKSSILSQWFHSLQDDDAGLGWLSLDRTQDDLSDFIYYMVAAIQVTRPDFGKWLGDLIISGEQPSVDRVTSAFINEVLETEEDNFRSIPRRSTGPILRRIQIECEILHDTYLNSANRAEVFICYRSTWLQRSVMFCAILRDGQNADPAK